MPYKLTDTDESHVQVTARTLAAGEVQHHGAFVPSSVAADSLELYLAVRDAVREENQKAADVERRMEAHGIPMRAVAP